jgi:uncharacterized protein YxeA
MSKKICLIIIIIIVLILGGLFFHLNREKGKVRSEVKQEESRPIQSIPLEKPPFLKD